MSEVITAPCCLIVEDEALIAMSLEAYLEEVGWRVCGPLSSGAEALRRLDREVPALAILDFALKDGSCVELARELKKRGVPFLVYSGHPRAGDVPPELEGVPWIEKPAAREDLVRVLKRLTPLR